jgi:glutamate 5-kinase
MKNACKERDAVKSARRIVVKIGSRVLVQRTGRPDTRRMRSLVADLVALRKGDREVVMVSSGAVGAGVEALGLSARPTTIPDLQMAAAVGQSRLMATYDQLFGRHRCRIAQVLLTHDDLKNRERHLNTRNTIMNLLRHDVIPIVNENDVVATEEIKFGDNDMLAALVSILVPTDLLIMLSSTDGLRAPSGGGRTRRVPHLKKITRKARELADGKADSLTTGGMSAKLDAASAAAKAGVPVVIANGRRDGVLREILEGKDAGTLIADHDAPQTDLDSRKRWIAFFHRAQGTIDIDAGASRALVDQGKSLLPIGIVKVEGNFAIGSLVNVKSREGALLARGLVYYSSDDIRRIKGRKTTEISKILGTRNYDEVIHRDNMVLL